MLTEMHSQSLQYRMMWKGTYYRHPSSVGRVGFFQSCKAYEKAIHELKIPDEFLPLIDNIIILHEWFKVIHTASSYQNGKAPCPSSCAKHTDIAANQLPALTSITITSPSVSQILRHRCSIGLPILHCEHVMLGNRRLQRGRELLRSQLSCFNSFQFDRKWNSFKWDFNFIYCWI